MDGDSVILWRLICSEQRAPVSHYRALFSFNLHHSCLHPALPHPAHIYVYKCVLFSNTIIEQSWPVTRLFSLPFFNLVFLSSLLLAVSLFLCNNTDSNVKLSQIMCVHTPINLILIINLFQSPPNKGMIMKMTAFCFSFKGKNWHIKFGQYVFEL